MREKFDGVMFGLAIGDAIGYCVEFDNYALIQKHYGVQGMTVADVTKDHRGPNTLRFSDDTQMSLATARAILDWSTSRGDVQVIDVLHRHYLHWMAWQSRSGKSRAPGVTCLSALRSGKVGTVDKPINDSKGCGGVMRTAPIGLVFDPEVAFDLGVAASAITHGHPGGYLPGGHVAAMVSYLVEGLTIREALTEANAILKRHKGHESTTDLLRRAERWANLAGQADVKVIHSLGGGWTGDEALAIAVYSALRYEHDFPRAILAATNHSGDSDSTASIAGAILGAHLGIAAIPARWVEIIEDRDEIQRTANALFAQGPA